MFDRLVRAAERAGSGGVPTRYDKATEAMTDVLEDERVHHVLATNKELTHSRADRTVTIEAGPGNHVVVVATSRRILVLVEGQEDARDPHLDYDLGAVTDQSFRDSLLRTSVSLTVADEELTFTPTEGSPDRFVAYVERVSACWQDLEDALASAREAMDAFERHRADGADTDDAAAAVRSALDRARDVPDRAHDAPAGVMHGEVDRVAAAFEELQTDPRVQRIEDAIDAAATADTPEATCEQLQAASEALATARSAVDDEAVSASLDDVEARLTERAEAFLDAAATATREAREADPLAAVERYRDAHERLEAATAVADDVEAFQRAAVADRSRDVATKLYEALQVAADHMAGSADESDTEAYERAKAALDRARDLAAQLPDEDPEDLAADVDRIEEALARSKWEWGKP